MVVGGLQGEVGGLQGEGGGLRAVRQRGSSVGGQGLGGRQALELQLLSRRLGHLLKEHLELFLAEDHAGALWPCEDHPAPRTVLLLG